MQIENNTVLITGGASGIGWALAKRFIAAGSEVVIVGRRAEALAAAQKEHPQVRTRVADVGKFADRVALAAWVTKEFPRLNVLLNNAGVMSFPRLTEQPDWVAMQNELAIDLEAPMHLTTLLLPHLLKQERPAVINVTSGLAYVPLAATPVYSAAKAGLSAFTQSLRYQTQGSALHVIELSPPHVNTDLGSGQNEAGMPLAEFTDVAMAGLARGDLTITTGFSKAAYEGSRAEREKLFAVINPPRS